jgi:hypothetical protein
MTEKRNAYSVLVRKSEGRRPFGRPRRRQEDNIKTELKLDGEGCVDWIEILQYRDKWRPLETLSGTVSFSRRTVLHGNAPRKVCRFSCTMMRSI